MVRKQKQHKRRSKSGKVFTAGKGAPIVGFKKDVASFKRQSGDILRSKAGSKVKKVIVLPRLVGEGLRRLTGLQGLTTFGKTVVISATSPKFPARGPARFIFAHELGHTQERNLHRGKQWEASKRKFKNTVDAQESWAGKMLRSEQKADIFADRVLRKQGFKSKKDLVLHNKMVANINAMGGGMPPAISVTDASVRLAHKGIKRLNKEQRKRLMKTSKLFALDTIDSTGAVGLFEMERHTAFVNKVLRNRI